MNERQLQSQVIDLARLHGWKVWHFHDSRRQVAPGVLVGDSDAAGFPDLVLVHAQRGRILFRELKSNKGRLTVMQEQTLLDLQAAGMDAAVWRPIDWPTIMSTLANRSTKR